MRVRMATRGSALARAQSALVAKRILALGVDVETVIVSTRGDQSPRPLREIGGTGVFVARLRECVLAGDADFAVHSAKDLPVEPHRLLFQTSILKRESPFDALCSRDGSGLADLPLGARVGTSSPRRRAQLLATRPDLDVVDLRGNVDTRLAQMARGVVDAVVLAEAGLNRLGRSSEICDVLTDHLPAALQGILALETTLDGFDKMMGVIMRLEDMGTQLAMSVEQAFLERLGAGCAAPVGVLCSSEWTKPVRVRAQVLSPDGRRQMRRSARKSSDESGFRVIGARLAREMLDAGAGELTELNPPGEEWR